MIDPAHCKHQTIFNGICVDCNAIVGDDLGKQRMSSIGDKSILVTQEILQDANQETEDFLCKSRKLALVLDLDKTVIDTLTVRTHEEAEAWIRKDEEHRNDFLLIELRDLYLVRFRPGFREFLRTISPNYWMQVYTLAQRNYAEQVVHKLDEDNQYFHGRILCKDDLHGTDSKNIRNFFPFSDSYAVVLDDSPNVWINENKSLFPGLLQIAPFRFFHPEANGFYQQGLQDRTLYRMAEVLNELHRRFYTENSHHILINITDMKRSVFQDCHLCFTGAFPEENKEALQYYLFNTEHFGGTFHNQFVPYATHIITGTTVTPIVEEALQYKGIYIVNIDWFNDSHFLIQRQKENDPKYLTRIPNMISITSGPKPREDPPEADEINSDDFDAIFGEDLEEEEDDSDIAWCKDD